MDKQWKELLDGLKAGHIYSMAKMITKVENRDQGWMDIMKEIYPDTGQAKIFGITGAPGTGKSTLTDQLTLNLVGQGYSVGIIAIDPSSPFSGGALLGDRLRMRDVCQIEDVFVRSMATRGALGGLSLAAKDVIKIMDAFGKDIIIIETVGVGQDEVDVVSSADAVMVVCIPGMGDGIQAIKAGIMEIADIFVVNKADRDGVEQVVMDIEGMLSLSSTNESQKNVPVVKTVAIKGEGISDLASILINDFDSRIRDDSWQEQRIREEILTLLEKEIFNYIRLRWNSKGELDKAVRQVLKREKSPYSIVQEKTASFFES